MKKERIIYIDMLRILAIFGVIIIHVSAVGLADYQIGSNIWMISKFYGSLFRWSVPVFFMISGACFLGQDKILDYKTILKKYILKLLLCAFIWGMFYSVLDQYIYGTLSLKSILIALYGVVTNHTGYHLWYLYDLAMLYLFVPFFQILLSNITKKQLEFLLLLWFVFSLGINQINELLVDLEIGLSKIAYSLPVISGYTGYFLLGYYLHRYEFGKKVEKIILIAGIFCMIGGAILNVWSSRVLNQSVDGFLFECGMLNCISSVGIWIFIKEIEFDGQSKKAVLIEKIASNVLGIYLVHVFFNTMIFRVLDASLFSNVFSVLLYGIVIYAASYLTVFIMKKFLIIRMII